MRTSNYTRRWFSRMPLSMLLVAGLGVGCGDDENYYRIEDPPAASEKPTTPVAPGGEAPKAQPPASDGGNPFDTPKQNEAANPFDQR